MREIESARITETVARLCQEANFDLGEDVLDSLKRARDEEESPLGRQVLEQILGNASIAREERTPICQDCGTAVVFLEVGQDAHITGGDLYAAVEEGVRQGYEEGYLRKSIVGQPYSARINTKDNTPAIIHTEMVEGDRLHITVMPKGGGSENMSMARLFAPAAGRDGIVDFVVNRVKESGSNPCPPVVVGVGIGGTFDLCALLAKKALMRHLGERHPDPFYAEMEEEILEKANNLGIGPMGLGGRVTALDVHIEFYPCHIASLPVAVNMQCHG